MKVRVVVVELNLYDKVKSCLEDVGRYDTPGSPGHIRRLAKRARKLHQSLVQKHGEDSGTQVVD